MSEPMRTDLHQHLLPEPLIGALARRSAAPRVVGTGPTPRLELAGEPNSALQERDHDPVARAAEAEREGIDRIVMSLSTALGIEALPADEARPLVDAFNHGILELGGPFELWGSALTADDVDALLDAGARGITLPALALVDGRAEALLDRLEERGAPLFVHPGPATERSGDEAPGRGRGTGVPSWWPAMTDYVAQMSAAWHAWAAFGRARHPRLRVVFGMLAGLAPLHAERLAARGGPAEAIHDPLVWFDSSSYGERTLDSMLRLVGVDRLVHGSDHPVIAAAEPTQFGDAVEYAMTTVNPQRALGVGVLA
jgi:6-methylsalicylate decarboxylase